MGVNELSTVENAESQSDDSSTIKVRDQNIPREAEKRRNSVNLEKQQPLLIAANLGTDIVEAGECEIREEKEQVKKEQDTDESKCHLDNPIDDIQISKAQDDEQFEIVEINENSNS
jgi:hypothetical protein